VDALFFATPARTRNGSRTWPSASRVSPTRSGISALFSTSGISSRAATFITSELRMEGLVREIIRYVAPILKQAISVSFRTSRYPSANAG
jgi:hypothetical protein